jgi:hypothetical protein
MMEATRSFAAIRLLALVALGFSGSNLWAEQRSASHLALDFRVKQGEITTMESQMLVEPGSDAEMTMPAKHGGEYRVTVSPRLVAGTGGVALTHVKVNLFEKQGNDWHLLASPELKSVLDGPAQAQITLPHAADGSSTEFTVGVTRKSGG